MVRVYFELVKTLRSSSNHKSVLWKFNFAIIPYIIHNNVFDIYV